MRFTKLGQSFAFCTLGVLLVASSACSSKPPAQAEAEDKPLKTFAQEITSPTTSLTLKAGTSSTVPVTVKDPGPEAWPANGNYPVHLSYVWATGGAPLTVDTARTNLTADLAPGASQTLKATVLTPQVAGQYTLKFTMVQERVAWFNGAGGKTLDIPVTVQ